MLPAVIFKFCTLFIGIFFIFNNELSFYFDDIFFCDEK
ncbi:hypothetical protein PULV_a0662 [Pseudoalteromonas ulvae UL12]|nr:hypothetical protein [Pseudoalteromonas ulvae UL12]